MNAASPLAQVQLAEHMMPTEMELIDFKDSKTRFITGRCHGKTVLDLGCVMHDPRAIGSRHFLHRAIHEVAARTVGLDLHEQGVEVMRDRGYDVRVGNAESFDLGEKFDVIVAGDIIEHLGNLDGFMRSVDASLEPGGMLIVATPNPWWWRFVVHAALRPEVPNVNREHTCWFCPRTWRQFVDRYGFTLGKIEHQARYRRDRYMPLPKGLRMTSWAAETIRKR